MWVTLESLRLSAFNAKLTRQDAASAALNGDKHHISKTDFRPVVFIRPVVFVKLHGFNLDQRFICTRFRLLHNGALVWLRFISREFTRRSTVFSPIDNLYDLRQVDDRTGDWEFIVDITSFPRRTSPGPIAGWYDDFLKRQPYRPVGTFLWTVGTRSTQMLDETGRFIGRRPPNEDKKVALSDI